MTDTTTTTTTMTTITDIPQSLTEEAKAQGIEVIETTTDQLDYNTNETQVDPLNVTVDENGEEVTLEPDVDNSIDGDTAGDASDADESDADLQTDVERHSKAVESIKNDLKSKGVDFNDAVREYTETGELSEATVKALEGAGYPQEVIESFIEGRRAIEDRFTQAVYDAVGGEKEYQRVTEWASKNLQKKTLDSFNRAIDNNNIDAITLMLEGMKAKMVAKMGTANKSIHGGALSPTTGKPKGYATKSEIIKAMSDPKYGRDAEYTRQVEQKMWATDFS